MNKHLIFKNETSNKYWTIKTEGVSFTVTFGKIGSDGTSQTKTFDSEEKCIKEAEKLCAEKIKKGYVDIFENAEEFNAEKYKIDPPQLFTKISYQEALTIFDTDQLFEAYSKYGDGEEDEEDESDELADWTLYYSDKDVVIDGDFNGYEKWGEIFLVKGNLTVNGKMSSCYYVTSNANFDILEMNDSQICKGKETVKYLQYQFAEDDEVTHHSRKRHISAPYYFSWFYSLAPLTFNPNTVIFAMYDWDEQQSYKTNNPHIAWQDYYYILKPELVYTYNHKNSDSYDYDIGKIGNLLKDGKSIFIDGFDIACMSYFQKGKELLVENDYENAFLHFKKTIELSPNFYLGYQYAGYALQKVKAYAQAFNYYEKGISKLPKKVQLPEFECLIIAALDAFQLKDYQKAASILENAPEVCEKSSSIWRLKGELFLHQNKNEDAKKALEKSIELQSSFTNNWLLGLLYFKEGNIKKADEYYKVAKNKYSEAQPYTEQQNLDYFYGNPTQVDWENKSTETQKPKDKGQEYWSEFFNQKKTTIGYDEFEKIIKKIPQEFRNKEMLMDALNFLYVGEKYVSGNIINLFTNIPLDKEIILNASNRIWPCNPQDVPSEFLDRDICLQNERFLINDIPEEYLDYDMCLAKVLQRCYSYFDIPDEFKDDKMTVAAIASGILDSSSDCNKIPQRFTEHRFLFQALDMDIKAIENIPAKYFDKEVFEYAKSKYGNTDYWKKQEAAHHPKNVELSYETFDKVWACHWTEDFIIKALSIEDDAERIYELPTKYITRKVAEVAVAKNSYDFQFIPKEFVTQEMCEIACSKDHGIALEYVPVAMRTAQVCVLAIMNGFENFKFVPLELRTKALCYLALKIDTRQLEAVPYEQYVAVFDELIARNKADFDADFLYLNRGIGYFFEENYDKAIADFQQARMEKEDEGYRVQHSYYYEGFANFKKGELEKAQELYKQAIEYEDQYRGLTEDYANAALPKVAIAVSDFDTKKYNELIESISTFNESGFHEDALQNILVAEKMLQDAQSSDGAMWATVWDWKRYILNELDRDEEHIQVCKHAIEVLSKMTLFAYVESDNAIRSALRNMYDDMAIHICDTASTLDEVKLGLEYNKKSFNTISPIEDKKQLLYFYTTKTELLHKALQFDKSYEKEFNKSLTDIKNKKLKEKDMLSDEFIEKYGLV